MTKKRTISKKKWKGAKSSIFTAVKRGDKKLTPSFAGIHNFGYTFYGPRIITPEKHK